MLTWGVYNTVGQNLNLAKKITDYDFFIVRSGYQGSGGMTLNWFYKAVVGANNETYAVHGVWNDGTNAPFCGEISFPTATTVRIERKGGSFQMRTIYGIKL